MMSGSRRRWWLPIALVVTAALTGALRRPMERGLARETAVRRLVREWRLPPTRRIRRAFRVALAEQARADRAPFELPDAVPPGTRPSPFSARHTHEDLRGSGAVEIAVFLDEPAPRDRLRAWLGGPDRPGHGIRVHLLETRAEFLDALERMDMVLFFGHANLGRGLQFGGDGDPSDWLALAPPRLRMRHADLRPDDELEGPAAGDGVWIRGGHDPALDGVRPRCRVLWLMGCRTEVYYRPWFAAHFPEIDLVTTHYETDTSSQADRVVQALARALAERRPIGDVITALHRDRSLAVLDGLHREAQRYGLDPDAPLALYTAAPRGEGRGAESW